MQKKGSENAGKSFTGEPADKCPFVHASRLLIFEQSLEPSAFSGNGDGWAACPPANMPKAKPGRASGNSGQASVSLGASRCCCGGVPSADKRARQGEAGSADPASAGTGILSSILLPLVRHLDKTRRMVLSSHCQYCLHQNAWLFKRKENCP